MVQMTPHDQAIVKALPGNTTCCDCGMKSPQWASVSFGNVFCLECSGVHRSLGVHISFVRSIAMDSWTDKQLALMKSGGNDKCNNYLKAKGIDPRTPIKQKYESDAAQLYKEVLKARVEGRPEPTTLPKPVARSPASAPVFGNNGRPMQSISGGGMGSGDPNGMERMAGETDQQYIARQTRLREEARARMAAKFGNTGGKMGGVGSGGMQGYGSGGTYNGSSGLDDIMGGITSGFSTGLNLVGGVTSSVTSSVKGMVQDPNTARSISNIGNTATSVAGSFWGSISSVASNVASSIAAPDDDDGLSALQREFAAHKPAQSKYGGFGNNDASGGGNQWSSMPNNNTNGLGSSMGSAGNNNMMMGGNTNMQEAPGLPGEDRNGVERLTGETDDQYVRRQTRLRDEAKARMAAKFGGGGLSSAGPGTPAAASPYRPATQSSSPYTPSPASGGFGGVAPAPASGGYRMTTPAPRSGGITPPRKNSKDSLNSDDFFASFGT